MNPQLAYKEKILVEEEQNVRRTETSDRAKDIIVLRDKVDQNATNGASFSTASRISTDESFSDNRENLDDIIVHRKQAKSTSFSPSSVDTMVNRIFDKLNDDR
eukprot:UN01842